MAECMEIEASERAERTKLRSATGDARWNRYMSEVDDYDKALVEGWKDDMDGLLIFAGLFSAIVTAFLIEGYKSLKQDFGEITVALLVQISQQLTATSNGTFAQVNPLSLPASFTVTPVALRVNVVWFISLTLSLSCALAATLIKQWARNFLRNAQEARGVPEEHYAQQRYQFALQVPQISAFVNSILNVLHISAFLFFGGLFDFMRQINSVVGYVILGILASFAGLYLLTTIHGTISWKSPYQTPLSAFLRQVKKVCQRLWRRIWRRRRSSNLNTNTMLSETRAGWESFA